MPTYDYHCAKGHHFELFQRISDKPVAKCPSCGAKASRRISGGAGLIFKGSGFYITDYGKDGKGPRKGESGSGGESTADSKEAPNSGTKAEASNSATPEKPSKKESSKKAKKEAT